MASGRAVIRSRDTRWLILITLLVSLFLSALDMTIVATALPTIVGELGGLDHISWVFTAYLLTSTVSVPLFGKISDIYGRRQVFQVTIVIFLVGSVLAGISQTMTQLILFRGIQGIGKSAGGLRSASAVASPSPRTESTLTRTAGARAFCSSPEDL